jgi:fatty-acyl-CoA synthase
MDDFSRGGLTITSAAIYQMKGGRVVGHTCVGLIVRGPLYDRMDLFVVLAKGNDITLEEMRKYLAPYLAKWWLSNGLIITDEIPHLATGKTSEKPLKTINFLIVDSLDTSAG